MKKVFYLTVFLFLTVSFLTAPSFVFAGPRYLELTGWQSDHSINNDCRLEYLNSVESEYAVEIPRSYDSDQIKISAESSIFVLKIDACNNANQCSVKVTPGQTVKFSVNYSFSNKQDELYKLALQANRCSAVIRVEKAGKSSSTLPTPTVKILPSPLPTQTGQCHGDSDCKNYSCKYCYVGQRVCLGGFCQECLVDSQCVSTARCIASVCSPKTPATAGPTVRPTISQRPPTSTKGGVRKTKVCGDSYCDFLTGEDCQNCPADCPTANYCCLPDYQFIRPYNFYKQIYYGHQTEAGLVPEGMVVVPPGENSQTYFNSKPPQICSAGKLIAGGCLKDSQCPGGFCKDNRCFTNKADNWTVAGDRREVLKIRDVQTNYQVAYIETYKQVKDKITSKEEVPGLEIKLEVQGQTAGKKSEVTAGQPTEARMTIKNISDHDIAVTGDIVYKIDHNENFTSITDNGSTLSYSYWDENGLPNIGVLFGTIKSRFLNYRHLVLLPKTQVIIYTNITPQETGEIEVVGTVYYSSEKRFAQRKTKLSQNDVVFGETKFIPETRDEVSKQAAFDQKFQKIFLKQKVKVNPKKCGFWGC